MKTSEVNFKELYLQELSKESYWRLFLDGNRQKNDNNRAIKFENNLLMDFEYGYLIWMLQEVHSFKCLKESALDLMKNKLNDSLTWEFLMSLNKTSFPFVDYLKFDKGDNIEEERTKNFPSIFGEIKTKDEILNVQKKALLLKNTYCKEKLEGEDLPWIVSKQGEYVQIETSISVEIVKQIYDSMLKDYEKKVEGCKSKSLPDDLILTIVDFLQNLELAHIFKDGNCRELYLVLNKELIKNGLCPTILNDPNDLDCKTPQKLLEEIKKGQEAFKMLVEKGVPYDDALSLEKIKDNIENCPVKKISVGGSLDLGFYDKEDDQDYEIFTAHLVKVIPIYYKSIKNVQTATDIKAVHQEYLFQKYLSSLLPKIQELVGKYDTEQKNKLKSAFLAKNNKKLTDELGYTKFVLKNIVQKGNYKVKDVLENLKQMYSTVNAYNEEIEISKFSDIDSIVSFVDDSIKHHLEHDVIGDLSENN